MSRVLLHYAVTLILLVHVMLRPLLPEKRRIPAYLLPGMIVFASGTFCTGTACLFRVYGHSNGGMEDLADIFFIAAAPSCSRVC